MRTLVNLSTFIRAGADLFAALSIALMFLDATGIVAWFAGETHSPSWESLTIDGEALPFPPLFVSATLAFVYSLLRGGLPLLQWVLNRSEFLSLLTGRLWAISVVPLAMCVYLLARTSPDVLGTTVSISCRDIFLPFSLLLTATILGLASLSLYPIPASLGSWPGQAISATPVVLSAAFVANMHFTLGESCRDTSAPELPAVLASQAAQFAAETACILLAWEIGTLSLRRFGPARPRGILPALRALLPGAFVLATTVAPVSVGTYLALWYTMPAASVLTDRTSKRLDLRYNEGGGTNRVWIPLSELDPDLPTLIDGAEDTGVYTDPLRHSPLNPARVPGAVLGFLNGTESGLSGLAAQVVRNFWTRPASSFVARLPLPGAVTDPLQKVVIGTEKIFFETPAAFALERLSLLLGRDHLTTMYVNMVPFGPGLYGVEIGATRYFHKPASQLSLAEAAMLAGMPKNPWRWSPWTTPEELRERRSYVLERALVRGHISEKEARIAQSSPLGVVPKPEEPIEPAPAFARGPLMASALSQGFDSTSVAGFVVTSTLNLSLQQTVQHAIERAASEPAGRGITDAAVAVIEPRTGEILAYYVGGYPASRDARDVPDLLADSPRQPASTFQPLVYAIALDMGLIDVDSIVDDRQRVVLGRYVSNRDLQSRGFAPWQQHLHDYRNVPPAELVRRMTPTRFVDQLRVKFKLQDDLNPEDYGVTLALGEAPVRLFSIAQAHIPLASSGLYVPPNALLRVESRTGDVLYEFQSPAPERVLSCVHAQAVTSPLVRLGERLGLMPGIAVNVGTTPSTAVAVAYSPDWVALVWLGTVPPDPGETSHHGIDGSETGPGPEAAGILGELAQQYYRDRQIPEFPSCSGDPRPAR